MPRNYSQKFVRDILSANPNRTGVALARACVAANLPAKYVAEALGVTRMSVYSWFRGKPVRDKNRQVIEVFTDLVESDTAKGMLPANNIAEAKSYIESMIGRSI
jgi:hypothetical protein